MLDPYKDPKYEDEMKLILETKIKPAKTPQEANRVEKELELFLIREKHKALMRLAKRAKMLPIKGAGVNSDV